MKIKKIGTIDEVVDKDGNLIGYSDNPEKGGDLESQAKNTTDYNAKISRQPYRYDMLGRFGFTLFPFFEGEDSDKNLEILNDVASLLFETFKKTVEHYYKSPNKLKPDHRKIIEDSEYTPEVLKEIGKLLQEKIFDLIKNNNNKIDESSVYEDVVIKEKDRKWIEKKEKDNEILDKDIKKIVGLLNKLDKKEIDELIKKLDI